MENESTHSNQSESRIQMRCVIDQGKNMNRHQELENLRNLMIRATINVALLVPLLLEIVPVHLSKLLI